MAAISIAATMTLTAQDSTHVITVKDITPRESWLKKLDGKFTFAPHYSSEMGLGTAFGYSSKAGISLIGNVSSQGYVLLGLNGAHTTRKGKWNISYNAMYSFLPTFYWGVGYVEASYNGNKTAYDKRHFRTNARLMRVFTRNFQAGPLVGYEWIEWDNFPSGEPLSSEAFRYGASAIYDSRDNRTAPQRGIYADLVQSNFTDFSGKPHFATDFTFNCYRNVWEGGILAFDLYAQFTYGDVPYTMLPSIGGAYRMRGYYSGRYRDNNAVSGQLELRQHIWEMFGAAVWIGAANLWGKYNSFDIRHSLPNAGAGIRWRLNGNTSLRFDYGFGKDGQNGFIFSVNEAF